MLEYKVALLNVWWSKGEKNVRFFESVEEQSAYFDKLVGGQTSPLTNFNMGNNIETAITFLDKTNKTIEELVSSNYCVIYKYEDGIIKDRRYFFAYPTQDSGRQMRVLLSLDDIQTNYIKYRYTIAPCNIKRACLNRFKKIGNNKVQFNNDDTSDNHLFEEEPFANLSKRIIKRSILKPVFSKNNDLNDWVLNNVVGWQYTFVQSNQTYNVGIGDGVATNIELPQIKYDSSIDGSCAVLVTPILKPGANFFITFRNEGGEELAMYRFDQTSIQEFRKLNNDASYFYNQKFSIKSPFNVDYYDYYIDNTTNSLVMYSNQYYGYGGKINNTTMLQTATSRCCALIDTTNLKDEYEVSFETSQEYIFDRGQIINSFKNKKFNPKLLGTKYKSLKLACGDANKFEVDYQKLGQKNILLNYKEAITPDITRIFLSAESGFYNKKSSEAYVGLVASSDNSIPYSNDQLAQFLAQNKNFHMQSTLNLISGFAKSIAGGVGKAATGNPTGGVAEGVGGLVDLTSGVINRDLTLDNLENAPEQLKNANGNVIFNLMVGGVGLIVEEWSGLESELEEINDFLNQYGFSYNHLDKIYFFDNIRKRFNYIEADVETINAPISNIEKERLRDLLKSIRFWNSDNVDYSLENYERWLEKYE